ncbi:hypothetical protein KL912_004898 [Ogataea haglerorum]|nr:hypothetical protein KL912_004898 [Ogataea haglerorum]
MEPVEEATVRKSDSPGTGQTQSYLDPPQRVGEKRPFWTQVVHHVDQRAESHDLCPKEHAESVVSEQPPKGDTIVAVEQHKIAQEKKRVNDDEGNKVNEEIHDSHVSHAHTDLLDRKVVHHQACDAQPHIDHEVYRVEVRKHVVHKRPKLRRRLGLKQRKRRRHWENIGADATFI